MHSNTYIAIIYASLLAKSRSRLSTKDDFTKLDQSVTAQQFVSFFLASFCKFQVGEVSSFVLLYFTFFVPVDMLCKTVVHLKTRRHIFSKSNITEFMFQKSRKFVFREESFSFENQTAQSFFRENATSRGHNSRPATWTVFSFPRNDS